MPFDLAPDGRWSLRRCQDGNANGLRRREIDEGIDTCTDAVVLEDALPGVAFQIDPALPGPEGSASGDDPVRFGSSDLASCSPGGTCTPGTCFLRSRQGVQYAVRLAGATGRLRILRYDPGSRQWLTR
jgi:hypothetical protein